MLNLLKIVRTALPAVLLGLVFIVNPTQAADKQKTTQSTKHANTSNSDESDLVKISPTIRHDVHQTALNYINGLTLTTSPILGLKSAWNASDLLYQIPSMNEDLLLLQDRDRFNHVLESLGSSLGVRPLLVISGGIEGMTAYNSNYTGDDSLNVNLSNAEIDLWAILSQWASGFVTVNFDGSPPQTGARVANSRLFLQRGFITIGNLEQSPFYATIGQLFVPFGRYSSAMVTTPMTKSIARIEARALIVGYYHNGFYAEAYGDNGDRVSSDPNTLIFQGGANIGYKNNHTRVGSVDVGIGYTSNLADSQGMQANGLSSNGAPATQFAGFGNTVNSANVSANELDHDVDALDLHLSISHGIATFITEYITAIRRFDQGDLSFNGEGALVQALQTELDINFRVANKPVTLGVAYNQSWDALALNLPQRSYFLVASTSFWKNTVESVEFRHDSNYAITANTGGGGSGDPSLVVPVTDANVGGSQNMVTLQLGAYF